MAVAEVTSLSTHRENLDESWNEYAKTGIAIYAVVHKMAQEVMARKIDCELGAAV